MEDKNRKLSLTYYQRKKFLFKKRFLFILIIVSSVSFLLFLSILEGWFLNVLLLKSFSSLTLDLLILFLIALFLAFYNILLARISLQLCYYFNKEKIPFAIVMFLFIIVYLLFSLQPAHIKNIIPLGVSKLCVISLFFSFWTSKLSETRLRMRITRDPRIFILSWRAFFICRWVLIACWLLSALGFALALVSSHPVIKFQGWEGLLLMSTFYLLFRAFVKNPNAHT